MDYIEITFALQELPPYIRELLPSWLEPLGFETVNNRQLTNWMMIRFKKNNTFIA